MLQTPAIFLSLLLASAYAALFHLLLGRKLRDLLFYWMAAVIGFASGQLVGQRLDLVSLTIGEVRIVEATIIALVFLVLARWLRHGSKTP
jgi:hypothetical protein